MGGWGKRWTDPRGSSTTASWSKHCNLIELTQSGYINDSLSRKKKKCFPNPQGKFTRINFTTISPNFYDNGNSQNIPRQLTRIPILIRNIMEHSSWMIQSHLKMEWIDISWSNKPISHNLNMSSFVCITVVHPIPLRNYAIG